MTLPIYTIQEIDAMIAGLDARIDALEAAPPGGGGGGSSFSPWLDARAFGVSASNPDNRTALQAAIDAARSNGMRRVALPDVHMNLSGPVDISGVIVEGTGPFSGCALVCTTPGADCVTINGHHNGVWLPGGRLANMGIFAAPGVACGIGVKIGNSDKLPDRFALEGLRITTAVPQAGEPHGTWLNAIWGVGTGRLSPPGIRGATIRDIEFFNVRSPGIVLHGITNLRLESVNGFTGSGVQAMTGIWIGGTAAVRSNDVQVSDCRVDGPINVTNTEYSGFEGRFWGGIQYDASAVGCVFSTD